MSNPADLRGKQPPHNASPEAVKLREQAILFGRQADREPRDQWDRAGAARNRALLKAAIAYAAVAEGRPTAASEAAERRREAAWLRRRRG